MFSAAELFAALLLPAACGAAGALLPGGGGRRPWWTAAGVALGALAGHLALALLGRQALLPPVNGYHWAGLGAVGLLAAALLPVPPLLRPLPALLIAGLAAWLLVRPLPLLAAWLGPAGVACLGLGIGAVAGGAGLAWETARRLGPPRLALGGLALAAGCAAVAVLASGSKVLGLDAAALAAALGGAAVVHLLRPRETAGAGLAGGLVAALWMAAAWRELYADLPLGPALLVLAGPAVGLPAGSLVGQPAWRALLALGLTLAVAGAGAAWAAAGWQG